jgi:hypothetical protein
MSQNPQPLPDEVPANVVDRRVRVRYTQSLKTFCQKGAGDLDQVWWMGSVRNIPGNGIGLLIQRRFDPGTVLTLELENAAQTCSYTLQVEVVRLLPQPGCWYLGCSFRQPLTDEEVQALL